MNNKTMYELHADGRMCYYTGYMCRNKSLESLRTHDTGVIARIRRVFEGLGGAYMGVHDKDVAVGSLDL